MPSISKQSKGSQMPPVSGGPPDADGRALEERVWEEGSTKPGFAWRSRLLGTLCSYRPETRLESESRTPPFSLLPPQEYVAYSHTGRIIPAIWFRYDLSPITVKYTERRQPLYRFITTVSGQVPPPRSRTQTAGRGAQPVHTRVFRSVLRGASISMAFHQENLFQRGMPLIHFHPLSNSIFSCSCS